MGIAGGFGLSDSLDSQVLLYIHAIAVYTRSVGAYPTRIVFPPKRFGTPGRIPRTLTRPNTRRLNGRATDYFGSGVGGSVLSGTRINPWQANHFTTNRPPGTIGCPDG